MKPTGSRLSATTSRTTDGARLARTIEQGSLGSMERFWDKVDKSGECWIWTARIAPNGYGHFWFNGKSRSAHSVAMELAGRDVPAGMVIDHTCNVRACVNVDHMRVVTQRENCFADHSAAQPRVNAEKTHCPHGHPYDEENTEHRNGRRFCRTCGRESCRKTRMKKKALK